MNSLLFCLCTLGFVWVAFSIIGSLFGRRRRHHGGWGGHHGYHGGGFGGGLGGLLGGLGLGWMLGNMFDGFNNDANIIDGETVGSDFQTVDHQLADDNGWTNDSVDGGGWDGDSGGWGGDGGDWGGDGGGGGWTDA